MLEGAASLLLGAPSTDAASHTTTLIATWALSIFGAVTGGLGLLIAWLAYRRDRRDLKAIPSWRGGTLTVEVVNEGLPITITDAYMVAWHVGPIDRWRMKRGWWRCPGDAPAVWPTLAGVSANLRLKREDDPLVVFSTEKARIRSALRKHTAVRDLILYVETISSPVYRYLGTASQLIGEYGDASKDA